MSKEITTADISYRDIANKAWPIILANSAAPLLGLVDIGIIGNVGYTQDIGALAFGSLIFSFLYLSFGFLRMSTTGHIAIAYGQKDFSGLRLLFYRALVLSQILGIALIIFKQPLIELSLWLFEGSESVEHTAKAYIAIRLWAAPAALGLFVLSGVLIGLGASRYILISQVILNGLNALLDLFFVLALDQGIAGIALGTSLAVWVTFFITGFLTWRLLSIKKIIVLSKIKSTFVKDVLANIFEAKAFLLLIKTNTHIFLRTLAMILTFAWFTNQSAQFGDSVLAANHILLQFIAFCAFFLDGFANVAEALVGQAIGAKQPTQLKKAIKKSSLLAFGTAIVLALFFLAQGNSLVALLAGQKSIQMVAEQVLIFTCLYIAFSFAAFQLDGIFIGALQTKPMRNSALLSSLLCILIGTYLIPINSTNGNASLWQVFILYVILRAITLGFYLPGIYRLANSSTAP